MSREKRARTISYMIGLFSSHVVAWVRFPSVLIVESRRLREKKRTRTTIPGSGEIPPVVKSNVARAGSNQSKGRLSLIFLIREKGSTSAR